MDEQSEDGRDEAVRSLRALILAGERYRQVLSDHQGQGIAERYPHPSDRRRTLVRLSDRGHEVVQQSREWLGTAFRDVAAEDLGTLAGTLRSLAGRLDERSTAVAPEI